MCTFVPLKLAPIFRSLIRSGMNISNSPFTVDGRPLEDFISEDFCRRNDTNNDTFKYPFFVPGNPPEELPEKYICGGFGEDYDVVEADEHDDGEVASAPFVDGLNVTDLVLKEVLEDYSEYCDDRLAGKLFLSRFAGLFRPEV